MLLLLLLQAQEDAHIGACLPGSCWRQVISSPSEGWIGGDCVTPAVSMVLAGCQSEDCSATPPFWIGSPTARALCSHVQRLSEDFELLLPSQSCLPGFSLACLAQEPAGFV